MNSHKSNDQFDVKNFSGFYKLTSIERLKIIQKLVPDLTEEDIQLILNTGSIELDLINRMIENGVGVLPVPFGLAVNFIINSKIYVIPMAIEEPSVIAAACNSAKLTLESGGFKASTTDPIMIGQIQILDIKDIGKAIKTIEENKNKILELANQCDETLVRLGGGAKDLRVKKLETRVGNMVICELLVNCLDAMGANAVNSMAEFVAPFIEEITGGRVLLRILSNLSDLRMAKSSCIIPKEKLGEEVVDNIVAAAAFAEADPYRAATHNKGVMNGISAVILATANDTRAIEAGAHAYAAKNGHYGSLTKWERNEEGDLVGSIEIPMAVGIIGGATKTNPIAKIALKILRVKSASELAQIAVTVGLAQNLGALRALATSGIISGHMKLHSRNIAITVGAKGKQIDEIAQKMIEENNVKFSRAQELLEEYKKN